MKSSISTYKEILKEWSRIHNLTGAKCGRDVNAHIEDSLYPVAYVRDFESCVDIGSGAGFPGIVLSINNPEKTFYLMEPNKKKYSFLCYVVGSLKLSNVEVVNEFSYNVKGIRADLLVSKAVNSITNIIRESKHLLKNEDSYYLLYKGNKTYTEINTVDKIDDLSLITNESSKYLYFRLSSQKDKGVT